MHLFGQYGHVFCPLSGGHCKNSQERVETLSGLKICHFLMLQNGEDADGAEVHSAFCGLE